MLSFFLQLHSETGKVGDSISSRVIILSEVSVWFVKTLESFNCFCPPPEFLKGYKAAAVFLKREEETIDSFRRKFQEMI